MGVRPVIFVSVGSVLPFDRLVEAADHWAGENGGTEVFFQIGDGSYEPAHGAWARTLPATAFRQKLAQCRLFVGHVGMGSILQASEVGRPMLLLPRLRERGEVTTDHQLHTAARLSGRAGLHIVYGVDSLHSELSRLAGSNASLAPARRSAPELLLSKVRQFAVGSSTG